MATFNDLKFKREVYPFWLVDRARLQFPNGYGISVVRGTYTYGGDEGLYECAVLKDNHLCYDTPITDDVIGYCDEDKVNEIIKQIEELKA